MSPPIFNPDGSEVSEIVLPDGSTASQVIGPDGNVLFEGGPDIPDSVVLLSESEDYDDTDDEWVSEIGDNIPLGGGDPNKTTMTFNSIETTVVSYDSSSYSQVTFTDTLTNARQTVLIVVHNPNPNNDSNDAYIDSDTFNGFRLFDRGDSDGDGDDEFRFISDGIDTTSGSPSGDLELLVADNDSNRSKNFKLYRNDLATEVISASGNVADLTGLSIHAIGDGTVQGQMDFVAIETFEGATDSHINSEISRFKNKYPIS